MSLLWTVLAGAIAPLSIEVFGDCLIGPPIGFALQPASVVSSPVAVTRYVESHRDQSLVVCGCGPCICGELRLPLQHCGGLRYRSGYVRVSLWYLPLSRAIPELWPIPPVRISLEIEARLLNSNVQGLFGTEDLGASVLTNDMQFQLAAQRVSRDFSNSIVARFRSQRLAAEAVRQWPHILHILAGDFFKISADLECQLEIVSEVPGVHPILALRTAATHSIVAPHCGVERELQRSFCRVISRSLIKKRWLACRLLDLVGVPAKSTTVLDKRRSSRSLEEELRVDQVVATTTATEVFNGGGSGEEGLQRLGGRGQVERILCTHHTHLGFVMAELETRVRDDLVTLPEEPGSWQRHAKEHLFHHCGHFRIQRRVIVMVARALDEGERGGFRTPAHDVVSGLRVAGSYNERLWPRLDWGWPELGLSVTDDRPDAH